VFYTNYNSHKGTDIAQQPNVALLLFWKELQRQIRIEGHAEKASALDSDTYFASRPRGSRIAAWASDQSSIIAGRESLSERVTYFEEKFRDQDIPRPPHWGGYVVIPRMLEFWQGRSSRMHDRLQYTRHNSGWEIKRLAP
ncbi:MAG: pyridoxamine 5'-phosphate oxidase, partial [Ferruginibacter sp.]